MNYYKNKNIWIIGASHGIGQDIFKNLHDSGANIAISARSKKKIEALISKNSNNFAVTLDISKEKSFDAALEIINKKWQKIDIIIFCAGVYSPMNIENFNLDEAKNILDVNLTGFVNLIGKIQPLIVEKKISQIAVISSVAGYFGMKNSMCYGASKAGLSNFAESLRYELKEYGIKVNLINPGFVKTRLTDQNNFKMPMITTSDKIAKYIIKKLPKNSFEIYFPRTFVGIMKLIRFLPYAIRAKIFS